MKNKVLLSLYGLIIGLMHLLVGCQSSLPTAISPPQTTFELPQGTILIRNGTIFDGTGSPPRPDGVIAFKDNEILFAGKEEDIQVPGDAVIIDANGGTIMPGIIDTHVHVFNNVDISQLHNWLQDGVTTMRDLGSRYGTEKQAVSLSITNLKANLAESGNSIPNVLIAGPLITAPGGYPITAFGDRIGGNISLEVDDVEEAQQTAEFLLSDGADGLKVVVDSGPIPNPWPHLSLEQVLAITEAAHNKRKRVSAHVTKATDAQIAADGGADDLAHLPLDPMRDDLIAQLVEQDIVIIPTLHAVNHNMKSRFSDEDWSRVLETRQINLQKFLDQGGRIALATDYPNGSPQGMPVPEMVLMQEAGMTPMQILISATQNAAVSIGLDEEIGTLERGKEADIIVVNGDPLEDITAMNDVTVVINNGEIILQP